MSRTIVVTLTAAVLSGLLLNGCAPTQTIVSVQLPLHQVVGQTTTYESTSKMVKDVEFDQPSLQKSKKDQTNTTITVKFDQTVKETQPDGTAITDIVIKAVQCKLVSKNEVRYEFDSAGEKAKSDSLNNLIGQSYRIAVHPDGTVKVVDAAKARAVVVSGDGQKLAQKILSDENILERHQLPLPKIDSSKITVTGDFTKKTVEVQKDGTKIVDVLVKSLQCKLAQDTKVLYAFDSNDKNSSDPIRETIGKSYRITVSPDSRVQVIDASQVRSVNVSEEAKKVAERIFSDESIIDRHQQSGSEISTTLKVWTQILPSPPGLLAPKTFEKIYTLSEISKDNKAMVTMSAKESLTQKAEGQKNAGDNMGIFAKMFDNRDEFTGKLVLNLSNGTAEEYEEKLVSSYLAQDKPKDSAPDAAPDTLVMRLTYGISLKKIN